MPPRYHPHIGGVEHIVKSLAEQVAEQGREVFVLTLDERKACQKGPDSVTVNDSWGFYPRYEKV